MPTAKGLEKTEARRQSSWRAAIGELSVSQQRMRKHVAALFFLLCATAANAASKWPDHEWLIGSTGVAWSNPEMAGGHLRMEIWFVFFGSEFYVPLPLMPFIVVVLSVLGFYLWWMFRHRHSRT